jgi:adenylate cyclase
VAKLIVLTGQQQFTHDLADDVVTIGRSADNTLCLQDEGISRYHCQIERKNGEYLLRDSQSANGTFVNGLSIVEHHLSSGDNIQIGASSLYFIITGVTSKEAMPQTPSQKTVMYEAPDQEREDKAYVETSKKLRNLMVLQEINKALNTELDLGKLLELIMDKAIELTSAERGFIILKEDGEWDYAAARNMNHDQISSPEFSVSKTVLAKVMESGEPVLTSNAQQDFSHSKSVHALSLRAIMCVPLKIKEKILGAVCLDSSLVDTQFSKEFLNLLVNFSNQAAIAIENARLLDEVRESHDREKNIRHIFQKYVPAEVVKEVLQKKGDDTLLGGKKLKVSILFSDIRNFTPMSSKMLPEDLVTFLNYYFTLMVDVILEEGGVLDKYMGDAIMALFGAPLQKPDDAARAVRAAVRMKKKLADMNEALGQAGWPQIRIGIGINTGDVIAGNIGSEKKVEYTVIGDTVNVAQRIESLNKRFGTTILINERTYQEIGDHFIVNAMDPVYVKGKSEMIQVYEVLEEAGAEFRREKVRKPSRPTVFEKEFKLE